MQWHQVQSQAKDSQLAGDVKDCSKEQLILTEMFLYRICPTFPGAPTQVDELQNMKTMKQKITFGIEEVKTFKRTFTTKRNIKLNRGMVLRVHLRESLSSV